MPKIDAQLGIRVTKDLKVRLEQQARSEMCSVSALIVRVMEEYLSSKGKGKESWKAPGAALRRAVFMKFL